MGAMFPHGLTLSVTSEKPLMELSHLAQGESSKTLEILSECGTMGGDEIGRPNSQESSSLSGRGWSHRKAGRAVTERHQPPALLLSHPAMNDPDKELRQQNESKSAEPTAQTGEPSTPPAPTPAQPADAPSRQAAETIKADALVPQHVAEKKQTPPQAKTTPPQPQPGDDEKTLPPIPPEWDIPVDDETSLPCYLHAIEKYLRTHALTPAQKRNVAIAFYLKCETAMDAAEERLSHINAVSAEKRLELRDAYQDWCRRLDGEFRKTLESGTLGIDMADQLTKEQQALLRKTGYIQELQIDVLMRERRALEAENARLRTPKPGLLAQVLGATPASGETQNGSFGFAAGAKRIREMKSPAAIGGDNLTEPRSEELFYVEINLATRKLTVGDKTKSISSNRIWDFLKALCCAKCYDGEAPHRSNKESQNANDMLRNMVGKMVGKDQRLRAHKSIVVADGDYYKLHDKVKTTDGSQVPGRRPQTPDQ